MIEQLRSMAVFAKVVEAGSFRAAAKALDLSPSVVSHHVARLEERVGAALLYRSTRRLSLTEDGRRLFEASRDMVAAAETGLNALADRSDRLIGRLRVAVTGAVFENPPFSDSLVAFARAYPQVELTISFSDRQVELIGSEFDAAIRVGWPRDSRYKGRKLAELPRAIVAAPSCFGDRAVPRNLAEACRLDWIKLAQLTVARQLIGVDGEVPDVAPPISVEVDSVAALRRMALAGMGLAAIPLTLVDGDIRAGRLVRLLPGWELMAPGVYALWPNNAPNDGLAVRFVRFMARELGGAA